ncbi:MAG: HEPN domain-containing protein [candidate division Zixibacteria bacterium]|nr:HEPN domain-containing protein [candidate division Zixibacteria bacterium]
MSIEIVLHPKNANRDQLRRLLEQRGYHVAEHFWEWPKGSLNYHWFDHKDYRSYDGVEATIYPPNDANQLKKLGQCKWALHTRTRLSASPADQEEQNETIRAARRTFGGNFYNDWHGNNRYTPIEDDSRDAPARGIYLAYEFVTHNIEAVRYALPEPNEGLEKLVGTKHEALATTDPTRVVYNALTPFAVAALEHFFSQCFKILLRYDRAARKHLEKQTRKVDLADVLAIETGDKAVEDIIADWYSFQNMASIHNAFSEWFGIDFWKLLRQRKKVGKRIFFLENRLNQLIQFRHGVVHRLSIDVEMRKQQIQELLDLVLAVINIFVDYLEKKNGKHIRD